MNENEMKAEEQQNGYFCWRCCCCCYCSCCTLYLCSMVYVMTYEIELRPYDSIFYISSFSFRCAAILRKKKEMRKKREIEMEKESSGNGIKIVLCVNCCFCTVFFVQFHSKSLRFRLLLVEVGSGVEIESVLKLSKMYALQQC